MYGKRVKIFIAFSTIVLIVCILRLFQMQVLPSSQVYDKIAELELQKGLSHRLNTLRGRILDRNGRILAADELCYQLNISYKLCCYADERVQRAKILRAQQKSQKSDAETITREEITNKAAMLREVIDKCAFFVASRKEVENKIKNINDHLWNLRTFLAWAHNNSDSALIEKYNGQVTSVPFSEAMADFETKFPDSDHRLVLTIQIEDVAEMNRTWPLLELQAEEDIFAAQVEFMETDGVEVAPKSKRIYPFGSAACQTIGWVGPVTQEIDKQLFADDRFTRYLSDDLGGREDGVEYACESVLRGKRGEAVYDANGHRIDGTEPQFGKDVQLTLDIELQHKIELRLMDCGSNPKCESPSAAVVIDVATGDILALVSTPTFDLNRVRLDYSRLAADANSPLVNRAINRQYPPGSVIKPLILIAASQSGKITAGETISCPAAHAPKGWPDCWTYKTSHSQGHNDVWQGSGGNNARNALKGSCNVYFSHLAERVPPSELQQWLYNFGYGREILKPPASVVISTDRNFRQTDGQISSNPSKNTGQIAPLANDERRWFGIGQGNLRATPLQVANAMATIARGGIYKSPKLFREDGASGGDSSPLGISAQTLNMVREGMRAVVEEHGGTAYSEFAYAGFAAQGIKVYGKTGSTERPEHAWFAGFAVDRSGRSVAVAVLVEGGKHGSSDAAPLARDILHFCVQQGYLGYSR